MHVGDKVRLIHGKEEGIVIKVNPGNYLEIDIGDGFILPVMASEVVRISSPGAVMTEKKAGENIRHAPAERAPSSAFAEKGLYLSFVPQNDREVHLHFINNTDWKVLFTVFAAKDGRVTGLASGTLTGRTSQLITTLLLKNFEDWPAFEVNMLRFSEQRSPGQLSLQYRLRCRVQSFHKHRQVTPLLEKTGHVYQVDEGPAPALQISPGILKEGMLQNKDVASPHLAAPDPVIDLHIEKLTENISGLSGKEILALQKKTFEQYLERAIAAGMDEITFVHGVGQGVLRHEMHKYLSAHPGIAYFQDAQKEKFGYGATRVRIR